MKKRIKKLILQWKKDIRGYPPSPNGLLAKALLNLCIQELEEALKK